MAYIVMDYVVMVYVVMAHKVMAYIVMAYMVMAYIVMAYIVMAYIVMAYIVMADIVMAYVVMAYMVMADILTAYVLMAHGVMAEVRANHLQILDGQHISYSQHLANILVIATSRFSTGTESTGGRCDALASSSSPSILATCRSTSSRPSCSWSARAAMTDMSANGYDDGYTRCWLHTVLAAHSVGCI